MRRTNHGRPIRRIVDAGSPGGYPGRVTEKPQRPFIRVRGRSFIALVLAPEPPVSEWLVALDAQMRRSASFFEGRPVVVDLAAVPVHQEDVPALILALQARDIRIIGVEGADDAWPGDEVWGRPPMAMTRVDRAIDVPEDATPVVLLPEPPSLVVQEPVRSGQSIVFAKGDLTVIGSVSSGAEIIAGGSIHVYGALRGRAIAGLASHGQARIFCRRMEAELLAIDGIYKSADDMDQALRGRAVQAWLEGEALVMAALG
jgi:septum site-determining protein MinC